MLWITAALLAGPLAAHAAEGTWTLVLENDRVADTDRHFTHGTQGSWTSAKGDVPDWAHALTGGTLPFGDRRANRMAFMLGQTMFTPDDIGGRDLVEEDRPYAGWLYGGFRLIHTTATRLERWEINVGVVGPVSQADDAQDFVHELIGVQRPRGWNNQLSNEPGLLLIHERKWRVIAPLPLPGLEIALTPHVSAAAGNVLTLAGGGATVSLGRALEASWGPGRIFPGIRGSDFVAPGHGLHWSLYLGVEARGVARNIFLDGNTFTDSHSVDKWPFVADAQLALMLAYRGIRAALTTVLRTREFEGQHASDHFGAITLAVRF